MSVLREKIIVDFHLKKYKKKLEVANGRFQSQQLKTDHQKLITHLRLQFLCSIRHFYLVDKFGQIAFHNTGEIVKG